MAVGAAAGLAAATSGWAVTAAPLPRLLLVEPALVTDTAIGAATRLIGPDLVRQWRDGLRDEVLAAGGAVALVRWDKVIVLMGLAREAGLATQHEQLDRSVFRVRLQDRRRRNA